jgi:hypothetical protein
MTTVGDWRLKAILRRLEKLKGRSVKELRERASQVVAAELEFRRLATTVGEPTDRALWANLAHASIAGTGQSAERLHAHFTTRERPAFFAGIRDGATAAEMREPRWAAERNGLLDAAEGVVAGRFDLLGHRGLSFGSPIDWHLDPVSMKRAPRIHWSRIRYLDAEQVGDHKVIWEINRHQHFFLLGRAYQVSGKTRYAECFAEHLTSWLDANPPKTGVNWASSLEVSYRAIAWLWALELFRGAAALTPALLERLLKYLYLHGRHLERYLSTYFSPNTHLTGEALGLLYLGVLLPEFRRAAHWRRLGWEILERELPKQIHADGVYFEQASYYHRYTVDIYLHAMLLTERNGGSVPPAMRERFALAVGHLADLTRPDGTIPIIGDDDGGSLVVLEDRAFADVRATLAVASTVLGRPEYGRVAGGATEEVLWLLGPAGMASVDQARDAEPPAHLSKLFAEGGYAVMRDGWGPDAHHAVIDGGPLGAMNCGHAHSDTLSVELSVGGCAILVDPGTYTYTSSAADRDHFRDSAGHNTVTVAGQSASVPDGPFSWKHTTDGVIEQWWSGPGIDRFVGSHAGFERLSAPARHRRSVLFVRGEYWVILDSILTEGADVATAHFHFARGATVAQVSPWSARVSTPCGEGRRGLFFAVAGQVDSLDWGEDWVSPSYGTRLRAPCGRVSSGQSGRRDLVTVLMPAAETEIVSVREVPASQGRAVRVDRPGTSDLFVFSTEGTVRVGDVEMRAEAAVIRRAAEGGEVERVALFGVAAELTVGALEVRANGAVEVARSGGGWMVEGDGRAGAAAERATPDA